MACSMSSATQLIPGKLLCNAGVTGRQGLLLDKKTTALRYCSCGQLFPPSPSCLQDVLDQSLYQCGIAGREALHRHWQYSVKGYASRLQQTAVEHQEEYQRLTVCLCVLSVSCLCGYQSVYLLACLPACLCTRLQKVYH